jgi:hypothetical protein
LFRSIERQQADAVREILVEADYQRSVVRLVRNMLPDGQDLREIQIRDPSEMRESTVVLSQDLRQPVSRLLDQLQSESGRSTRKAPGNEAPVGLLRAVDLDSRQLRIDTDEGNRIPVKIPDSIGDDEIGLLLNHRVRARGATRKRGQMFVVEDLEPWDRPAPRGRRPATTVAARRLDL